MAGTGRSWTTRPAPSRLPRPETIREVRVHGNAFLADADVLSLAGITVGSPLRANGVEDNQQAPEGQRTI